MAEELPVEVPEDIPVAIPGDTPMSAREAGRLLASFRHSKPKEEPEPSPLMAEVAQAESGEQPVADPEADPGTPPVEATEPAEELPPIEPPRSWTKEEKEEFQSYPREAQEKIARREQERETALRRGQNEAAEQRKGIETEREQLRQAVKELQTAAQDAIRERQASIMGEFADIKTQDDIMKMATEDWPRFARYQAHQHALQQRAQQIQQLQQQQDQEYQAQLSKWHTEQDEKFNERNPGLDKSITEKAVAYLKTREFSDDDLKRLWNGQVNPSMRDYRWQEVILDATRYREAKAAVPKAAARPVPKVQKPGSPAQRAPDADAHERALFNRLDETKGLNSLRTAAQIIQQRRAARQ